MRQTNEQREEMATFRGYIVPALGGLTRIVADPEGWPMVPGRLGRLEWRGREWATGEARVFAFTDRARMIGKLLAVPGVRKSQIGDTEAAVSMAATDQAAIQAVARLLRTRVRRPPREGAAERMAAVRARIGQPAG